MTFWDNVVWDKMNATLFKSLLVYQLCQMTSSVKFQSLHEKASDAALIRDVHRKYEKRFGRKSTRGELDDSAIAQPEETQYEGRVRDSDDFDWMKGGALPATNQ